MSWWVSFKCFWSRPWGHRDSGPGTYCSACGHYRPCESDFLDEGTWP